MLRLCVTERNYTGFTHILRTFYTLISHCEVTSSLDSGCVARYGIFVLDISDFRLNDQMHSPAQHLDDDVQENKVTVLLLALQTCNVYS